jgi:2-polyprenyl-3-methyl-5-hydroxy-6-metoxy-1,4-benzoquinol methylase
MIETSAADDGRPSVAEDYRSVNRANWDERAPAHAVSPDYAVDHLLADPTALSRVVSFDRPRLGDLAGVRGLHLQCHIGTDTLSLHRLGATMTGLDFSGASIAAARRLAEQAGAQIEYVQAEVYRAWDVLSPSSFDLIYTGIGALCWLPEIRGWAEVVAGLLRPGGRLFLREGHPMLWALADARSDGLLVVDYPYFERPEPEIWDEGGTYVQTDAVFSHNVTHNWNHGLGEIVTALLDQGMRLTMLVEHDSVPWESLPGQMSRDDQGEWRLADRPWRVAQSYTLQAIKDA